MRGLPPQPPDVAHLVQTFDINGKPSSVGFWLFAGSLASAGTPELVAIATGWLLTCLPELLAVMHDGASATACQLSIPGLSVVRNAPPNAGTYTGGQADDVALGLKWQTGDRGRSGWATTFIPAVPDRFITRNWQINQTGWGNLLDTGSHLFQQLNELPAPDGSFTVVGTLNRARDGRPLPAALFAPFVGVNPVPKVVTIRRRIPARGGLSPDP